MQGARGVLVHELGYMVSHGWGTVFPMCFV